MVRGRQLCTQLSIFEGSLAELLRTTAACTFSTSQLPKVVRTFSVLCILTWTYASRHNGVHFFDITTSKSAPSMRCFMRHNSVHFFDITTSKSAPTLVCFEHFDLDMCFAPQRRALFRHLNFQKCSGVGVYCTFWLGMTWTYASHHTGVEFFISHLPRWLRTRRFSEPTFRSSRVSRATNHWKNTMFCDFYLFACLHLLSCASFFSSLTLPASAFSSVHTVGSLTFKLPSIRNIFI